MVIDLQDIRAGLVTGLLGQAGGGVAEAVTNMAAALPLSATVYGGGRASTYGERVFRPLGPVSFGYLHGLVGALRSDNLDIIHTHGLWMHTSVAATLWGEPRVVSPHGMLQPWALRYSSWRKRFARLVYEDRHLRGASCLHALNTDELRSIRSLGFRNPVCVIPNGVHLGEQSSPEIRCLVRKQVPQRHKVCLYIGRLHKSKNLIGLLKHWGRIRPKGWKLVIAGWDQLGHAAELQLLAVQLALADCVEFVGPKYGKEKHQLFLGADAFVLPSHSEGLPVSVLEAWSYRLPVAMTSECNLQDGFACRAAVRISNTCEGIESLLTLPEDELTAMGERGRGLVEERFSWPLIAQQMAKVYAWVLGRADKPEYVEIT